MGREFEGISEITRQLFHPVFSLLPFHTIASAYIFDSS
jgi:hypothetical protein